MNSPFPAALFADSTSPSPSFFERTAFIPTLNPTVIQAIKLEIGVASDIAVSASCPSLDTKILSITLYNDDTSIDKITGTDILVNSFLIGKVSIMFSSKITTSALFLLGFLSLDFIIIVYQRKSNGQIDNGICNKLIEKMVLGECIGKNLLKRETRSLDIYVYGLEKISDLVDLSVIPYSERVKELMPKLIVERRCDVKAVADILGIKFRSLLKVLYIVHNTLLLTNIFAHCILRHFHEQSRQNRYGGEEISYLHHGI